MMMNDMIEEELFIRPCRRTTVDTIGSNMGRDESFLSASDWCYRGTSSQVESRFEPFFPSFRQRFRRWTAHLATLIASFHLFRSIPSPCSSSPANEKNVDFNERSSIECIAFLWFKNNDEKDKNNLYIYLSVCPSIQNTEVPSRVEGGPC